MSEIRMKAKLKLEVLEEIIRYIYWVVRKVRADVEGKLKRRKFKF